MRSQDEAGKNDGDRRRDSVTGAIRYLPCDSSEPKSRRPSNFFLLVRRPAVVPLGAGRPRAAPSPTAGLEPAASPMTRTTALRRTAGGTRGPFVHKTPRSRGPARDGRLEARERRPPDHEVRPAARRAAVQRTVPGGRPATASADVEPRPVDGTSEALRRATAKRARPRCRAGLRPAGDQEPHRRRRANPPVSVRGPVHNRALHAARRNAVPRRARPPAGVRRWSERRSVAPLRQAFARPKF